MRFVDNQAIVNQIVALLNQAKQPLLIGFIGELGAGKTTLIKQILRQYFHNENLIVPSPSFNIIISYDGIIHADLYRIKHDSEILELGLDELLMNHHILCEWLNLAGDYLPRPPDYIVNCTIQADKHYFILNPVTPE